MSEFARCLIVCAVVVSGCGSLEDSAQRRAERGASGATRTTAGDEQRPTVTRPLALSLANTVIRVNDETELDAGRSTPRGADAGSARAMEWGADGGPMVSEDAGTRAAELAWLVTHIEEGAETAGPAGPPNVRALAGYGADGVRAVIPLFRAGDARRVPHARGVLQRVAQRACRGTADTQAPRRLIAWIETGSAVIAAPAQGASAPSWPWARGPEFAWPSSGVERMRQWAAQGLFCAPPNSLGPDAGVVDAGRALLDARAP